MSSEEVKVIDATGHCIGYGPENASYLFWGLEEKGEYDYKEKERNEVYVEKFKEGFYTLPNEEIYSKCKSCEEKDKQNLKLGRTYWAYTYIYEKLSEDVVSEYQIGSKYKPILIGNIKPFAKNKTNNPYKDQEDEWIRSNGVGRTKKVINFLKDKAKEKKYVFCFGAIDEYLLNFCKFGKISFEKKWFDQNINDRNFYYKADNLKIYLLRHPSNGWLTQKQICELINNIKPELNLSCNEL